MNFTYQIAIFGFCADLTDPNATSEVVGALVLCDFEDGPRGPSRMALVVAREDFDHLKVGALTRARLKALPELMRKQIDHAFGVKPAARLSELMSFIHDMLRNSVHVLHVSEEIRCEDGNSREEPLPALLIKLLAHYEEEMETSRNTIPQVPMADLTESRSWTLPYPSPPTESNPSMPCVH